MPRSQTTASFTAVADGFVNNLRTPVGIRNNQGLARGTKSPKPDHFYTAIWDTGATGTTVTAKVVAECHLTPISKAQLTGVHGSKLSDVYLVDVYLPNRFCVPEVKVVEVDALAGDADILIGMDIIRLGDLAVNHYQGKTSFSFRMPSLERIDYAAPSKPTTRPQPKVGRNAPCPCGSGQKYKKCCGA